MLYAGTYNKPNHGSRNTHRFNDFVELAPSARYVLVSNELSLHPSALTAFKDWKKLLWGWRW